MESKHIELVKRYGIDLEDLSFPIALEYQNVLKIGNTKLEKCIDNIIFDFVLSLEKIKSHDYNDFTYYKKKLNSKEISFWGQRYEIVTYSRLMNALGVQNFKRGKHGIEADFSFLFNGQQLFVETTSLNYGESSNKSDPIDKILRKVSEKETNPYANQSCALFVDVTNLQFHRKIERNFRTSLSDLTNTIDSSFGTIQFQYSFTDIIDNDIHYRTDVYEWRNKEIDACMNDFISAILKPFAGEYEQIHFPRM